MTKNDLLKAASVPNLNYTNLVMAYDALVQNITDALLRGESVVLRDFGSFSISDVPERNAVHFVTKEPIVIPAHKTVKFKPSKYLRELINNNNNDNSPSTI